MNADIQIALADEQRIFRDGVRISMKTKDRVRIAWEAESVNEMMKKLRIELPDVLLMDLGMPGLEAIKTLQIIKKEFGELKVIVFGMADDKELVSEVMEQGANAYLTKRTDADEIYKAIVTCIHEDFYFNDLVNAAVLLKLQEKKTVKRFYPQPIKFSDKELKILKLISEDKTTEEISESVYLSPRTVETIRQNMKTKVGVKTIGGLLMYAFRNKLVQ